MDRSEQLQVLEAAAGDPVKLILVVVDLAYSELSAGEREILRETLQTAAIPHWFDEGILATLLGISADESHERLTRLNLLSVVEPFPARGSGTWNVHETARLTLRKAMATDDTERFRTPSACAAAYFDADQSAAGRIEWIFQLLCADPERGATELEKLDREWSERVRPEDVAALALALTELQESGLVDGRARVWVLLAVAWARSQRESTASLLDIATEALTLAGSLQDTSALRNAYALMGSVQMSRGDLPAMREACLEYLATSERLAQQNPQDLGSQYELALSHMFVGALEMLHMHFGSAERELTEASRILEKVHAQDPENPVWRSGLATFYGVAGSIFLAQGKEHEAWVESQKAPAIGEQLAEQDPTNNRWQDMLASYQKDIADGLLSQGKLDEAQAVSKTALAICYQLAEQDPSNMERQHDLARAHIGIGDILASQGKLAKAQLAFEDALAIRRQLAEQDPSNSQWKDDLADAHIKIGGILESQRKLAEALAMLEEDLQISRKLVDQDPSNGVWQRHTLG